jgi:acid phosphatase family membrane protein YuiD
VAPLDASSLRRQVGKHAAMINKLTIESKDRTPLRERMGHTRIEIIAGILVGIAVAAAVNRFI